MRFKDIAIIISQKKYGENSLIVKVFSQNHGICCGFVKNAISKKNRAIYQIGNLISFELSARSEDSLASFQYCEVEKSFANQIMFEKLKLNCLTSLLSLFDSCFFERENHRQLFDNFQQFLLEIASSSASDKSFLQNYVRLELEILKELGYGVDLTSCAVSNSEQELEYVSPKSARAVSREVAAPYRDKLLKLPKFLLSEANFEESQILDGLKLSGYFLEKFIFKQYNSCGKNRGKIINALAK